MFEDEYERNALFFFTREPSLLAQDSQQSLELNPEKPLMRISTAPARPLTPIEEFKRSKEFFFLEQTVFSSNNLLQKNYLQIDLDSADGQKSCKKFLSCLERLCEVMNSLLRKQIRDTLT